MYHRVIKKGTKMEILINVPEIAKRELSLIDFKEQYPSVLRHLVFTKSYANNSYQKFFKDGYIYKVFEYLPFIIKISESYVEFLSIDKNLTLIERTIQAFAVCEKIISDPRCSELKTEYQYKKLIISNEVMRSGLLSSAEKQLLMIHDFKLERNKIIVSGTNITDFEKKQELNKECESALNELFYYLCKEMLRFINIDDFQNFDGKLHDWFPCLHVKDNLFMIFNVLADPVYNTNHKISAYSISADYRIRTASEFVDSLYIIKAKIQDIIFSFHEKVENEGDYDNENNSINVTQINNYSVSIEQPLDNEDLLNNIEVIVKNSAIEVIDEVKTGINYIENGMEKITVGFENMQYEKNDFSKEPIETPNISTFYVSYPNIKKLLPFFTMKPDKKNPYFVIDKKNDKIICYLLNGTLGLLLHDYADPSKNNQSWIIANKVFEKPDLKSNYKNATINKEYKKITAEIKDWLKLNS